MYIYTIIKVSFVGLVSIFGIFAGDHLKAYWSEYPEHV